MLAYWTGLTYAALILLGLETHPLSIPRQASPAPNFFIIIIVILEPKQFYAIRKRHLQNSFPATKFANKFMFFDILDVKVDCPLATRGRKAVALILRQLDALQATGAAQAAPG
jgi:hypothetical protein